MLRGTENSVLYFVKSGGVYGFEERGLLGGEGGRETEFPTNAIEGRFTGRKRGLGSQYHTMQVQQRHLSLKLIQAFSLGSSRTCIKDGRQRLFKSSLVVLWTKCRFYLEPRCQAVSPVRIFLARGDSLGFTSS